MIVIRGKNDKNINVILIGKRDDLIYKRNGKIRGGCWIRISNCRRFIIEHEKRK